MARISFSQVNTDYKLKNKRILSSWIKQVINMHGKDCGALQFTFCDDGYLLELNRRFLKHDTLTDIITFNYTEANTISGEIFISLDRIIENATLFQTSITNELHRVIIHGVLHLLGFDDKTKQQKDKIHALEDAMLNLKVIRSFT